MQPCADCAGKACSRLEFISAPWVVEPADLHCCGTSLQLTQHWLNGAAAF